MSGPRRAVPIWLLVAAALALGVVVLLSLLAGTQPYHAVGDADPGVWVRIGTPLLRCATDLAAVVCTGSLGFVIFLTKPQASGVVSPDGYARLLWAARAAIVWLVGAVSMAPFSASDVAGVPLSRVLPGHVLGLFEALEQPRGWLLASVVVAALALGCWMTFYWRTTVLLWGLALLALLPPLVTAHGSSDVGHDLATAAIVVHVPAAAVWLGVLLALLAHLRRCRAVDAEMLSRYARLATACWLVLVASGGVDALVLTSPAEWVSSAYGLTLLAKTVVAVGLGIGGLAWRARVVDRSRRGDGRSGLVRRLLATELLGLVGVLALSVHLTHLAVPNFLGRELGTQQTLLGYRLFGPPTLLRLAADWRIDVLFGPLALLLAAGYLLGMWRLRRCGRRWPTGRMVSWLAGCLVLLLATSSGLGRYAAAMFSVHMASHMLISMVVPVLLALGGPLSLIEASAPGGGAGDLPGRREWLDAVGEGRLVRALTHPGVAVALFAGSPFVLYFTGLFDALVRFHWGHMAITAWFLVIGYLFAWPVLGVDRTPRPLPNLARLGVLLAAMPADVVFGAALINLDRVIGNGAAAANMYQALALPWVPNLFADQRLGGVLALVIGELVLFGMMAVLLARWHRLDDALGDPHPGGYRDVATEPVGGATASQRWP